MANDEESKTNSSLMTISVIENLISEVNDCLGTLKTEKDDQYELIRAMGKAVNKMQREELFNLRKSFE